VISLKVQGLNEIAEVIQKCMVTPPSDADAIDLDQKDQLGPMDAEYLLLPLPL